MKNILPIIITFLVTAIASSSITYFVTVDKNGEKEEAEVNIEMENDDNNSSSSRPLTGQEQVVTGSSTKNAVEIKSAEIVKTINGEDAVVVTFVYSRLSGDSDSLSGEFGLDLVYQNGVSLNLVYEEDFTENPIRGDKWAEVKPGYSNELTIAFILIDSEADILVECVEEDSDYTVSRTFELN